MKNKRKALCPKEKPFHNSKQIAKISRSFTVTKNQKHQVKTINPYIAYKENMKTSLNPHKQ